MSTLPPPSHGIAVLVELLGLANLLVGLYSIRASYRYRSYAPHVRTSFETVADPPGVTIFVPCCGAEEGLQENLEALLDQDYPSSFVRFTVESAEDTAMPTIQRLLVQNHGKADLVVAGPARSRGQKVHNLLAALESAAPSEVLVFADSDGRPGRDWLRHLVAALDRPGVGVASSYRFYLPEPGTLATRLRSVWNASVLTLLGDHDHNFAWGGSMAVRRETFERTGVADCWTGALSDDYQMTHAVRKAGLRVEFVPQSLVASRGRVTFWELVRWCGRQIAITRVYWPALFRIAAATQILYTSFLLLALLAPSRPGLTLLAVVLGLSFWSGGVRAAALAELAPKWRPALDRDRWAYVLLVPLASLLTVLGVFRALGSRRIEWRGKVYEMRSPTETAIVSGSATGASR